MKVISQIGIAAPRAEDATATRAKPFVSQGRVRRGSESQDAVLMLLQLQVYDAGSTNYNEKGATIHNRCFYLSLACSYVGTDPKTMVQEVALCMKRRIEKCALAAHPEWAGDVVGENEQAFSDFLVYALGVHPFLSGFSVAIYNTAQNNFQIFKGRKFLESRAGATEAQRHHQLLTILHLPGHFQSLLPQELELRLTLERMLHLLERNSIPFIVTDA